MMQKHHLKDNLSPVTWCSLVLPATHNVLFYQGNYWSVTGFTLEYCSRSSSRLEPDPVVCLNRCTFIFICLVRSSTTKLAAKTHNGSLLKHRSTSEEPNGLRLQCFWYDFNQIKFRNHTINKKKAEDTTLATVALKRNVTQITQNGGHNG